MVNCERCQNKSGVDGDSCESDLSTIYKFPSQQIVR